MMIGKVIVFVVGSSASLLGCADLSQPGNEIGNDDVSVTAANLSGPAAQVAGGLYSQIVLQTGTPLDHDEDSFGAFTTADIDLDGRPDLVYIKRRVTGNGTVEVHDLSAASGFQQFIQQTGTGISTAEDANGDFAMADVDGDGRSDLVFIKRRRTPGRIEVHVLSGASGYQQFSQHTATKFLQTEDNNGDFIMADVDGDGRADLVFFKSQNTGTGTVEIHALSAASGFQQSIQDTGTGLTAVEAAFGNLTLADVDRDGRPDLVFIKRRKTGSGAIEVHVLSAASGFQQFIQDIASGLSQADDGNGDFTLVDVNRDGKPDLVFIKRRSTGTGTIELHGFAG